MIYICRFQSFHDVHSEIVNKAIKKHGQVVILVMESFNINQKLFKYKEITQRILNKIKTKIYEIS